VVDGEYRQVGSAPVLGVIRVTERKKEKSWVFWKSGPGRGKGNLGKEGPWREEFFGQASRR